jgi:hypothetical protein
MADNGGISTLGSNLVLGISAGYAAGMPRPPQPPQTYVVRHLRVPRPLDLRIRTVAKAERRKVTELLILLLEDGLPHHLSPAPEPAPARRRRRPGRA